MPDDDRKDKVEVQENADSPWEATGRQMGGEDQRIMHDAMRQLVIRVGEADLAYERAQRRALADKATEHDKLMEEMSRRSLETRVHELIEFARGFVQHSGSN